LQDNIRKREHQLREYENLLEDMPWSERQVQKYFGGGLKAQQEMIDNAREKLNEAYNTRDEFLAEYGDALEDAWDQAQPQIKQPQAKQTQLKPQARRPVSTPSLSDTELNAITDKVGSGLTVSGGRYSLPQRLKLPGDSPRPQSLPLRRLLMILW